MRDPESRDPAEAWRAALVEGLLEVPAFRSVRDRVDLIHAIRRACPGFPDVPESAEGQQHVVAIVRALLDLPRALPALLSELELLAPGQLATEHVRGLIEAVTLADLLPGAELDRGRALVHQAGGSLDQFDRLVSRPGLGDGVPAALRLADRIATGRDLAAWVARHASRIGISVGRASAAPSPVGESGPLQLDPAPHELLTAQLDNAQHPYQFFEGHVPALSKIYVHQRGEPAETGQPGGEAVLTVPQMLTQHRDTLVVAGPGMGKSTLVWRIQRDQAQWWLDPARTTAVESSELGRFVPIAVPASLLVEQSIDAAIAESVRGLGCQQDIRRLLGMPPVPGGSWLVMIDGVDEVLNSRERSVVLNKIANRIGRDEPSLRFLITTRPLPFGYLTDLRTQGIAQFGLKGFDRADLTSFAVKWFAARDRGESAGALADRFVDEVNAAGLSSLVEVPLLATIAALAFESDPHKPLPQGRALLYEWFVTHLRYGRPAPPPGTGSELEKSRPAWHRAWQWVEENIVELLEHLADGHLDRHADPIDQRAEAWVTNNCPDRITMVPGWRAKLRDILTATSLLTVNGAGQVAFTHHSFAEFLAAGPRALDFDVDEWTTDILSPHRRGLAIFVLARRTELPDPQVEALLDGFGEHLIAAGDILAEGIGVAVPLRRRVVSALVDQLIREDDNAPEALRVLATLSADDEVAALLADIVDDSANPPWVRATVADALDVRDRGGRLRRLVTDHSLPDDVRRWAAEQSGDVNATPAPATGPVGFMPAAAATPLSRHVFYRDLNDLSARPEDRLRIAVSLAVWGDPAGSAALRRSLTDPVFSLDQRLVAARTLRERDPDSLVFLRGVAQATAHPDEVRAAAALAVIESGDSRPAEPASTGATVFTVAESLAAAILTLPFINTVQERRRLVSLAGQWLSEPPAVAESQDARAHVTALARAYLSEPRAVWSLLDALATMAPAAIGTIRAHVVVESATLAVLLTDSERDRAVRLLEQVEATAPATVWQLELRTLDGTTGELVRTFGELAGQPIRRGEIPPAAILMTRVASAVSGPLGVDLQAWCDQVVRRFTGERPAVPDSSAQDKGAVPGAEPDKSPSGPLLGGIPPRSSAFAGRLGVLAELAAQMRRGPDSAVLVRALHGMGGVGKSQIAVEFVHRHRADYDLIWWIPAEQPSLIVSSLTSLAHRLGLDDAAGAQAAVTAVREALSTGRTGFRNWLLVFDNAESIQQVRPFLPTGGTGNVLITSRSPDWGSVAQAIEVDVFTRDESIELLRDRVPELTDDEAHRLADALGDLPLALEQAAAWRAATGMPTDEYLRILDEMRLELLDAAPGPDYPNSVAAAFTMSFDRLQADNPAAMTLLRVCSILAPEPIARQMFAVPPGAPISPPELAELLSSSIGLARAIRDLQRYALVRVDHRANTIQLHRLVQTVVLGQMADDERTEMRNAAQWLLATNDPGLPERPAAWARYLQIRPHFAASGAATSDDPYVQDLVVNVALFLWHWGDHLGASELAEQAYDRWHEQYGAHHPRTLRIARLLTTIRQTLGDVGAAAELIATMVDREASHEDRVETLTLMASHLRAKGAFATALTRDADAIEIARRELGPEDPISLAAAGSLATSVRLAGRFRDAKGLAEDTYRLCQVELGDDAMLTMLVLDGLIVDLRESGDHDRAQRWHEDLYQRQVEQFGGSCPATLRVGRNLAISWRRAGDLAESRRLAETILDLQLRRYGEEHPDTMAAAATFAIELRIAGDLQAAESLGSATAERYARMFGVDHPQTLVCRAGLAVIRRLVGDPQTALAQNRDLLAAFSASLGADHPTTLTCAMNVGSDLFAAGEPQSAFEHDATVVDRFERVSGIDHPLALAATTNLALDLRALGRGPEADQLQSDTLMRMRRTLGDQHPATLSALRSIRAEGDIDLLPI
ncbi:hypothetical protein GCM10023107_72550 [Actinoplanes octamycinicus]|nr:FxSxx-COOH system tetratricopeptide repeat protein [Actinoplanes octamycinicus]GIE60747.1 hypothetical protein Aoc01nite_61490 [Actinoplanes octamycinicus]